MILFSIILSILLSTASFVWGYFQAGYDDVVKYIFAFGVLWLISHWRRWKWFSSFALLISLVLAVFGLWMDFIVVWMFSGAIFALAAWDLHQFQMKLSLLPDREDKQGMTRRRLMRIGLLAVAGLMVAMGIQLFALR
jgi:hypothetical protein